MHALKKALFKFMELGLGVRPYFALETKNPIFINFKLTEAQALEVQKELPKGYTLLPIRFTAEDEKAELWISYNLYELKYPKPELSAVVKARCEINTFVTDAKGRKGVFVFSGSPFVSKESRNYWTGKVCDFAERLVMFIYGCGRLIPLEYKLSDNRLKIAFECGENALKCDLPVSALVKPESRLSDDYLLVNDISFFNHGKTYDLVNVNSAFIAARFYSFTGAELTSLLSWLTIKSPFGLSVPDKILFHRGEISYLVNALNQS